MNRSTIITFGVLVFVLLVAGFFTLKSGKDIDNDGFDDSIAKDNFERIAASSEFTNLAGDPVALSDYAGQVLVVNSWASWCPFCVTELPDLATIAAEFADQNVTVLAINRAESQYEVEAYLKSIGTLSDLVWLLNESDSYYSFIGGFSMPETVFYDTEGNVVVHKRGFMALDEIRELTQQTIDESTF